ncbi:MAG: hypothetical protein HC764_02470 [Pleurocapsa sp. CRU_1_2]|nr:hypothetical protein [Pleurocapsa sp. CRU_1_2]
MRIAELLENTFNLTGIYAHHLQRHWIILQRQPELLRIFNTIINSEQPIKLEPVVAHKLNSLGLIKLSDNKAVISCELYRRYFQDIERE